MVKGERVMSPIMIWLGIIGAISMLPQVDNFHDKLSSHSNETEISGIISVQKDDDLIHFSGEVKQKNETYGDRVHYELKVDRNRNSSVSSSTQSGELIFEESQESQQLSSVTKNIASGDICKVKLIIFNDRKEVISRSALHLELN